MAEYKGTVSKLLSRPAGRGKAYSIALKGQDGFHGLGFSNPGIKEGDYVEFVSSANSRGFLTIDTASLVIKQNEQPQSATPVAKSFGGSKGGLSKDDYWTNREARDVETQKRIEIQSCRNSAIALVSAMLQAGAIPLPQGKTNKHETIISETVKMYTDKYLNENKGEKSTTSIDESVSEVVPKEEKQEDWS